MSFSSRVRKKPEMYDASLTSTEYTRSLRQKEVDSEAMRKSSLAVSFADGVTRCARLDKASHGKAWVMSHEWKAKGPALQKKGRALKQSLKSHQVVLYRVDGKTWRRLRLVRPVNAKEAKQIQNSFTLAARASSAKGAEKVPPAEVATSSWWRCEMVSAVRCRREELLLDLGEATRTLTWQVLDDGAEGHDIALLSEHRRAAELDP